MIDETAKLLLILKPAEIMGCITHTGAMSSAFRRYGMHLEGNILYALFMIVWEGGKITVWTRITHD